jgi:zinc transporter ZupT
VDQQLLHMGMLTALGISLHNFPEGVAVYLTALQGVGVGLPLAIAIAVKRVFNFPFFFCCSKLRCFSFFAGS